MTIDAYQIVNAPWEDILEIIERGLNAERDLANCEAALRAAERREARKQRALVMASWIAAILLVVAIAGWVR